MFPFAFYITNRYYSCLYGSAGILARNGGGRGCPRSHSCLQRYEKSNEKSEIICQFDNNFLSFQTNCDLLTFYIHILMMKQRLLLIVMILFGVTSVVEAQKTVIGTVTDTKGEPLYGVTIRESEAKNTAVTDLNGHFQIQVSTDAAILQFRYMGMEPYKASVKGKASLSVKMKEETTTLAEAVVVSTGYQRLSRERSTAAFGFVDSTKLNRVMQNIELWTAQPDGQYDDLNDIHRAVRAQYQRYVNHVQKYVLGKYPSNKSR